MAIALVSHTIVNSTSAGGSGSITSSAINTTGASVIFLSVGSFGGVATVTDSASNTWIPLPILSGINVNLQVFYCFNPTTNASHTFTYPGASGTFPSMTVGAFSGTSTLTPPDFVISDNASTVGTTHTPGTLGPTIDNSLLLSLFTFNNSNYTSIDSSFSTTDTHSHDASSVSNVFGYQIQTTATSRTPTITTTVSNNQYATYGICVVAPQATTPALISHTSAQSSNSNNVTTGAISTLGASLIVLEVGYANGTIPTITDSAAGNTWTLLTPASTKLVFAYCINPTTSASHTFTASLTSSRPTLAVAAFSGTLGFDVQSTSSNNISTITPTNKNALIVTGVGTNNSNSLTPGNSNGFVLLESQINVTNSVGLGFAYKVQPSNISTSTQWNSNDGSRFTNIATFNQNPITQLTEVVSDTLSLSDSLSIVAPATDTIQLSDSLSLSDTIILSRGFQLIDSFTLSDLLGYGLSIPVVINGDTLSLSDAVLFLIGVGVGKSDTITLSDLLNIAADVHRLIETTQDNILLSDFLTVLIQYLPSYSDSFSLSDQAKLTLSLGISQTDSLVLLDSVMLAVANNLQLTKSDTLSLSDNLAMNLSGDMDSYIRHYLNDVPR